MIVEAQVSINGTAQAIWSIITDMDNASHIYSGIEKIEILEHPARGLIGLKWRETRILFGKPAAVEKWITDAVENESYTTRAEDGGFVFVTTKRITTSENGTILSESHESRPMTFTSKIMSIPMKLFFKGVVRKALLQDLNDVKTTVEGK